MTPALIGAAIAGVAGTPHCLGMCGTLAATCGDRPTHHLAYHAARIGTYAVLGAVAGTVGAQIPGPSWAGSLVAGALIVWFAAAMAGLVPEPRLVLPGVRRLGAFAASREGLLPRLLLGVANGLLPCGLVYATLSLPVAIGTAFGGALAMTVFGLATAPGLTVAALTLRRIVTRWRSSRRVLALMVLTSGVLTLAWREGLFTSDDSELPPCHAASQP